MTVKQHYDNHLGEFYEWMTGDAEDLQQEWQTYFMQHTPAVRQESVAVDLGAGHGLQTVALANLGYSVKAIDFNKQLLTSLNRRAEQKYIQVIEDDFIHFKKHCGSASLIVCLGDTIAHLESISQLKTLLADCFEVLNNGGQLILSFRDYSYALTDTARFIPVKSDDDKILTCVLDFTIDSVLVTDLLHVKQNNQWVQKISSYRKLRLTVAQVEEWVTSTGFSIILNQVYKRMHHIIAVKPPAS
jgi:2-polyprenyl-3-methyl-5-hydroxy-6-metoxy-1,4-benzoquinol methylase